MTEVEEVEMEANYLELTDGATPVMTKVADLLGLTEPDAALVDAKALFTVTLKQVRKERGFTQSQLSAILETSQQSVARAERGAAGTSLDFLLKALVGAGLTLGDIGRLLIELQERNTGVLTRNGEEYGGQDHELVTGEELVASA